MKKDIFIYMAFLALLSSCASLTKSQVEAVNQFAHTSKNFSAYPSKILTSIAGLREKRGLYAANLLEGTPDLLVGELESNFKQKKIDLAKTADVDITFKIIDTYAQSLLLLSSDKSATDLAAQSATFGVSLDSLITTYNAVPGVTPVKSGIGGLIGSLIMAGGTQFIRARQANEIKRFVPAADEMINVMTTNLLTFLQSGKIAGLIDNEQAQVHDLYLAWLKKLHTNNQPLSISDERDYMELITELDDIKILRTQTINATDKLRKAHHKLLEEIKEKKDLKEVIAELQALYDNVKEVKTTISAIDNN